MMASFPNLMSLDYTKRMEDELDLVAGGDKNWRDMLGEFYGRFSNSLRKPRINPTSGPN